MTIKDITALLLPRQFRAYYGHQRSKKRSIPPSQGKKPEVSSCIPGHWGEGSSWVGCLGRVDILALISSYDPVPSPPSCKTPLCPAVAFAPHVTLRAVDGGGGRRSRGRSCYGHNSLSTTTSPSAEKREGTFVGRSSLDHAGFPSDKGGASPARPHFYVRAKHGILSVGHVKDLQQPCRSHRCRAGVL